MTMRVLLFGIVLGAVCSGAQSAVCSLSGQTAGAPFDARMVEFVSDPKPIADSPGLSVQMIARVAGLRPLVIEVLDTDVPDQGGSHTCERKRIYSVDGRLREVLSQLNFGDLVRVRMLFAFGGTDPLVLTELEKISGAPAYFHQPSQDSVCANRTGTLVVYQAEGNETTAVYSDGSIYYQDPRGKVFDRQRLGPDELARLMQSFQRAGFETLANAMPAIDRTRGQPSISLICARHQRVLVAGNQAALAPVLQSLQEAKTKALAEAYYFLKYDEKREITFLAWPFSQLPIDQAGSKIRAVTTEEFAARCAQRPVQGDFRMFHQDLPAQFFEQLPASFSKNRNADPHRDAYVQSGSRVYRVSWRRCPADVPGCQTWYQLRELTVDEVATPEDLLTPAPAKTPPTAPAGGGRGCPVFAPAPCRSPADDKGCSALAGIRSVLWPAHAGVALGDEPAEGRSVTDAEFARNEALYRELLAAENCGQGIDFVEGRYWYRNVRMSRADRAAQPR